jgi:type II secretory pathway pseudopilin PulG
MGPGQGCKNLASRLRRGFLAADTIVALFIIGMLSMILVVGLSMAQKARDRLADQRSAIHLAETLMTQIQTHQPIAMPNEAKINVQPVEAADGPVDGQWVRVQVEYHKATASLVGLTPTTVTITPTTGESQ